MYLNKWYEWFLRRYCNMCIDIATHIGLCCACWSLGCPCTYIPFQILLDIIACLAQLSGLIVWPVLIVTSGPESPWSKVSQDLVWAIPLSLFLISIGWWENYVDINTRMGKLSSHLVDLKDSKKHPNSFPGALLKWKTPEFPISAGSCYESQKIV